MVGAADRCGVIRTREKDGGRSNSCFWRSPYWKVRLCAPVTRGSISGLWGSLMSSDIRYNASGGLAFRQIQVTVEPRC